MRATDIMSRPVIAVSPDTPLASAIRLMIEHRVSGLPVLDAAGRLVGILTEGDLLRRVETDTAGGAPGWLASFFTPGRVAAEYVRTHGRRVGEVMTPDVVSVEEQTPLANVVQLMQQHGIKRVPVVRDGKVIGIVSRADVMRLLGAALDARSPSSDDDTIRRAILDRLDTAAWGPNRLIDVSVANGIAHLDGCVFDMREREAIEVVAENVPGVKRVENRLVCIEPRSGVVICDPGEAITSAEPHPAPR